MKITAYEFGHIDIAGRSYSRDVIVFPDRVRDTWWRKEGHSLCLDDLGEVLADPPEVLVVGTGYYGHLRIPVDTRLKLESRGIRVVEHRTARAVQAFNQLQRECANIVAALHLTC